MGQEVLSVSERPIDWASGALEGRINDIMQRSHERSADIASQINSIDSYLSFVQREHTASMERHSRAVVNLWKERIATRRAIEWQYRGGCTNCTVADQRR